MATNPLAIQMYTLRDLTANDFLGTLRAVAELGYRAVELAGLGGLSASQVRAELDALGLQAPSAHVPIDRLEGDTDQVIDEMRTLGASYVVCPFLPPERRRGAEDYRAVARTLNKAGRAFQDSGLQLCYHNHDFEFQRFGDATGLAILFEESDPALVKAELDVYWAAFAGYDPADVIRGLAGSIPLVHLKDLSEDRTFAEVGHGTLDFPSILAACDEAGVEWLIVEQDRCQRPPLESVGMSLAYLQSLGRA